jgi:hypothetical protein
LIKASWQQGLAQLALPAQELLLLLPWPAWLFVVL